MARKYLVSDGKIAPELHPAEEGAYTVTAPLIPDSVTEADTIEDAFETARDAAKALSKARAVVANPKPHPPPNRMKRRDLEQCVGRCGCTFLLRGGKHDIWANSTLHLTAPTPRHNDVKTTAAKTICRELGVPPPSFR